MAYTYKNRTPTSVTSIEVNKQNNSQDCRSVGWSDHPETHTCSKSLAASREQNTLSYWTLLWGV